MAALAIKGDFTGGEIHEPAADPKRIEGAALGAF